MGKYMLSFVSCPESLGLEPSPLNWVVFVGGEPVIQFAEAAAAEAWMESERSEA